MAVFGIEGPKDPGILNYMDKVNRNLKIPRLDKNPFNGKVIHYPDIKKDLWIIIMDPIYPRLWLIGPILIILPMLFTGIKFSWWQIPGVGLFASSFFWSKYFFFIMLRLGLKKARIKNKVKLISLSGLIREIHL